jgi:hypothetical protein
MGRRAEASGIRLTESDAALVKGMLNRGDRQHDIAAWFGVNGGRIAEVATGATFEHIQPSDCLNLPPKGPYPNAREATAAIKALAYAKSSIEQALSQIHSH